MIENERNRFRRFFLPLTAICGLALLLCSCATPPLIQPAPANPANPVSFNGEAGKGDWIKLKLHLENGKEIGPVMLDTGWPYKTVLDKSLAPLLGKRTGSGIFYSPFMGGFVRADTYNTPKLYLGSAPLLMGSRVYVCDLQKESPGLKGILGMDCLRHYCVQLDFSRNEMRFLDPGAPANGDFGHPIPLLMIDGLLFARSDVFGTGKVRFCPDTGCQQCDAMLKPKLLRRLETNQNLSWSTSFSGARNHSVNVAGFSTENFEGESYNDLTIAEWAGKWPDGNLLGLPFMARNLVTFDFPRRTMYLQKENSNPRDPSLFATEEAAKYLLGLKRNGQLPGWTVNDVGEQDTPDVQITHYPVSLTFNSRKESLPPSFYHYVVVRNLPEGPWKLSKAWQSDVEGHLIRNYSVQ
ncbi:MAG TPA: hypothetical protein VMF08_00980 [Candidatus Sulfotelmatobacter sp.]|nr:hypothetical protein [Candidatus Sulfotelmatobacter sp.]